MESIIPSGFLAVNFSTKSLVPEKTPSVQDPQMKTEEHGADRLALDAGSDSEVVAPEPWTSMSVIGSGRLLPNIRGWHKHGHGLWLWRRFWHGFWLRLWFWHRHRLWFWLPIRQTHKIFLHRPVTHEFGVHANRNVADDHRQSQTGCRSNVRA